MRENMISDIKERSIVFFSFSDTSCLCSHFKRPGKVRSAESFLRTAVLSFWMEMLWLLKHWPRVYLQHCSEWPFLLQVNTEWQELQRTSPCSIKEAGAAVLFTWIFCIIRRRSWVFWNVSFVISGSCRAGTKIGRAHV